MPDPTYIAPGPYPVGHTSFDQNGTTSQAITNVASPPVGSVGPSAGAGGTAVQYLTIEQQTLTASASVEVNSYLLCRKVKLVSLMVDLQVGATLEIWLGDVKAIEFTADADAQYVYNSTGAPIDTSYSVELSLDADEYTIQEGDQNVQVSFAVNSGSASTATRGTLAVEVTL